MFPASYSNITKITFKQRQRFFKSRLYALNCFFTAHVTFELEFPTFRFQCSIEFRTAFISIVDESLPLYIKCFLEANFRAENALVDSIVFLGVMSN